MIKQILLFSSLLTCSYLITGCDSSENQSNTPNHAKTITYPDNSTVPTEALPSTELIPEGILSTDKLEPFWGDLDKMKERKLIRALVTYSKTDFFIHNGKIKGLQAELLQNYENHLNEGIRKEIDKTKIVYIPVTFDQLIPSLVQGKGDISAALLTATDERKKLIDFTKSKYSEVSEVIVRHKTAPQIDSLEDLAGKTIIVLKGSSYAEHLHRLNKQTLFKENAIHIIEADSTLLSEDILEIVNAGIYNYTIIDDYKARLWLKALTNLEIIEQISLSTKNRLGWGVRKQTPLLQDSLNEFIHSNVQKGSLLGNILIKRYLGSTKRITNPLLDLERDRLIRLLPHFEKYAEKYKLDPLGLAAQAYQESQLKQDTKSHKGAVGVMQLLPSTAADPNVNIKEIHKVDNNIHAGAKYMDFLSRHYLPSEEITPINRFLLSLAAYNAGPGNLRKMQKLTTKMGLDPNVWFGNVEIAAGRIIGRETVYYVSNIYKYYTIYNLSKLIYADRIQTLKQYVK